MASWMIHLRVAQKILEQLKLGDTIEFIMGNIAPDSGIPSLDGTGYIPSSEISHFRTIDEYGFKDVHEEQFIARYFTEEQRTHYTKRQYTFYFAYLTHLITDKIWSREIVYPAKEQFSKLYDSSMEDFFAFLKKDWYDMDFLYLKKNPDFSAFQIYQNTNEFKNIYLDFFSEDAFEQRKEFIVEFYRRGVETVEERKTYLTMEQLERFVDSAVYEILRLCELYVGELLERELISTSSY